MSFEQDVAAVLELWRSWTETREWALRLIERTLQLSEAQQVLQAENRGSGLLPGTEWHYRTHGIGIDISKSGNKGGIDFDFDKPTPDWWRLREFLSSSTTTGQW